jgi:hypothetical protein
MISTNNATNVQHPFRTHNSFNGPAKINDQLIAKISGAATNGTSSLAFRSNAITTNTNNSCDSNTHHDTTFPHKNIPVSDLAIAALDHHPVFSFCLPQPPHITTQLNASYYNNELINRNKTTQNLILCPRNNTIPKSAPTAPHIKPSKSAQVTNTGLIVVLVVIVVAGIMCCVIAVTGKRKQAKRAKKLIAQARVGDVRDCHWEEIAL